MKKKVYRVIYIIFTILTFIGSIFVILNNVNAGYAIIPMLFTIVFGDYCKNSDYSIEK